MYNVLIYGAGSIGNHLAHASRSKGWCVTICDIDSQALARTKEQIYPLRYGSWDAEIKLGGLNDIPDKKFDFVIIATPPDTHLSLAKEVLQEKPPKVLLIEKSLCTPDLKGMDEFLKAARSKDTFICVGYNNILTKNTRFAEELLRQGIIGQPLFINASFLEHWRYFLAAHPWLGKPQDSYLGFSERGGGALSEQSHCINLWQHLADFCGMGKIAEVSAMLDMASEPGASYDRSCLINVKTEKGLAGSIAQDVITDPAQKKVRIQGSKGYLEWFSNFDDNHDAVIYWNGKAEIKKLIPKIRPDDFKGEIDHVENILDGKNSNNSPISLDRALDTMMVIKAAYASNKSGRRVKIDEVKNIVVN